MAIAKVDARAATFIVSWNWMNLTKKCRSFRVLTGTVAGVGGGFLSFLSKEVDKNQISICLYFGEAPWTSMYSFSILQ